MDENINLEQYKLKVISHLPEVLQDIEEFRIIFNIVNEEINLLNFSIEDTLDQFFIDTATWGLTLWEKRFAIDTGLDKSYEERRDKVKAKRRGYGTVTKGKMKSVAEAFTDGRVDITEEHEHYKFLLELINSKNKVGLNGLNEVINEIKPAHLSFNVALTNERNLNLKTKVENYDINYILCGTTNCGIEPEVVTDGLYYLEDININTNNSNINQIYPVSGTINTGGERL